MHTYHIYKTASRKNKNIEECLMTYFTLEAFKSLSFVNFVVYKYTILLDSLHYAINFHLPSIIENYAHGIKKLLLKT